jgi:hypothetical protein
MCLTVYRPVPRGAVELDSRRRGLSYGRGKDGTERSGGQNERRDGVILNRVTQRDPDRGANRQREERFAETGKYAARATVTFLEETHAPRTGRHGHILTCRYDPPAATADRLDSCRPDDVE